MLKEFPPAITKALEKFLQDYEPATSRNVKYFLSSLAVQYHIHQESGDKSFTAMDAYHFMEKAGFTANDQTQSPEKTEWLLKRKGK